jgi:DNA polymerase I
LIPRLFLIDSFGFIFRAYHARARSGAPPMRTSSGISTEAVYIFHNMVRKLRTQYNPEYVAAVFESTGPTFRDEVFADYKANRTETPPDLLDQVPWIRKTLEAMSIPILEYDRFEADDVIGTLAARAHAQGVNVVIVSSDKDMLQLVVDGHISMLNPMKDDAFYDAAATEQFMGVKPSRVADLLALMGDTVDNIPGAPGIGEKGARDLLVRFGSVENALDHAAEVERKTYRESLQNNRDRILLSKRLATIHTDVPVPLELEALAARPPDDAALRQLYRTLEFTSLLRDLGPAKPSGPRDYQALESAEALEEWLAAIPAGQPVAVAAGEMLGRTAIACCAEAGSARFASLDRIPARASVCHDVKALIRRFGVCPQLEHDVMLYGFLATAEPGACDLRALSERYLEETLDSGAAAEPASEADAVLRLFAKLRPEIESAGLAEVYRDIDLPLAPVLGQMEETGILIDHEQLSVLSRRMEEEIARISAEIYELTGKTFNINSPQQLGKILFEDLQLPAPVKYGKGKTISTAAGVLEELAEQFPIARKVLDFRQLAKLKGTYSDALPALIDPFTGRLHTTFHQTGAATGRLASSDPNLQNIPIRTALGREIRAAFIPRPGWKLIVADYSQIELRLLAHFSRDPVLLDAFHRGEDIHTRTAAEVFGVPPIAITPDHRRRAKAVNFGIVYGQSPFGLAQSLGIERKEAEIYIRAYFERYAGVRKWLDATIAEVRRTGFARNLFGRRRPIPDMNSRNFTARGFAERTAVNTPLQGTAADLIKLAMIRVHERLAGMEAKLLLQVHDELLLEAPSKEAQDVRAMVKKEMENVHKLEVPLLVETGVGENWRDAK